MSTLLLIRHGQARAFDTDSDRLSDLGNDQAKKLGEHLVRSGVVFDEVWAGSLVRQRRTAEIVRDAFRAAGRTFPDIREDSGWNEYDAHGILETLMPALAARDEGFRTLVLEFEQAAARSDRNRFFQRMFEVLMDQWQRGAIESEGVESFVAFHTRAREAFVRITASGGNRRVGLFTSGGPIGVSVQEVLEAPPRTALRLNWRVKNASLTEMVFSAGRVSLESFNGVEYLDAPSRTFR
jgi:broad specificity phosphatase PhoE